MRFLSNRNNVPLFLPLALLLIMSGLLFVSPGAKAQGLEGLVDPSSNEHFVRTAVGWMEAFYPLQTQYIDGPGDGEYGDLDDLVAAGYFPPYFTKEDMVDGYLIDFYFNENKTDYAVVVTPMEREDLPAFYVDANNVVMALPYIDTEGDFGLFGTVIDVQNESMSDDDEYVYLDMDDYSEPDFVPEMYVNAAGTDYVVMDFHEMDIGLFGAGWVASIEGTYMVVEYDYEMGYSNEEIIDFSGQ